MARETNLSAPARELAATVDPDAVAAGVTAEIMRVVFPDNADDGFTQAVHTSVRDNIRAIFDVLTGRTRIAQTTADGAIEFAHLAAELGVPFSLVDRAYRIGVATMWEIWFGIAVQRAREAGTPLEELVGGPSVLVFGYIDHILRPVEATYDSTREELVRTREHLRRSLLSQLLDGSIDEMTGDVEEAVGYRLGDVHIALLVHTEGATPPVAQLATLRSAIEARGMLEFHHGPRSWLVWLGRREPFGPAALAKLRRAIADSGLTIAVGEPARGLEGLRRTRHQALDAGAIQQALGAGAHPCVWASDVRLELLLLQDHALARRFVTDELGPLAGDDRRACRLRETLTAWFASGSHGGAAGLLGVHKNTVRNRLRDAEQLLGTSLWIRSTEVQVALRLHRILRATAGS